MILAKQYKRLVPEYTKKRHRNDNYTRTRAFSAISTAFAPVIA